MDELNFEFDLLYLVVLAAGYLIRFWQEKAPLSFYLALAVSVGLLLWFFSGDGGTGIGIGTLAGQSASLTDCATGDYYYNKDGTLNVCISK